MISMPTCFGGVAAASSSYFQDGAEAVDDAAAAYQPAFGLPRAASMMRRADGLMAMVASSIAREVGDISRALS